MRQDSTDSVEIGDAISLTAAVPATNQELRERLARVLDYLDIRYDLFVAKWGPARGYHAEQANIVSVLTDVYAALTAPSPEPSRGDPPPCGVDDGKGRKCQLPIGHDVHRWRATDGKGAYWTWRSPNPPTSPEPVLQEAVRPEPTGLLMVLLANYEMDEPHWNDGSLPGRGLTIEKLTAWLASAHDGDCTGQAHSCVRCHAEHWNHKARWIASALYREPSPPVARQATAAEQIAWRIADEQTCAAPPVPLSVKEAAREIVERTDGFSAGLSAGARMVCTPGQSLASAAPLHLNPHP